MWEEKRAALCVLCVVFRKRDWVCTVYTLFGLQTYSTKIWSNYITLHINRTQYRNHGISVFANVNNKTDAIATTGTRGIKSVQPWDGWEKTIENGTHTQWINTIFQAARPKKQRTQHTLTSHILYIERAIEKCIAVACRQHKGEEATERKKNPCTATTMWKRCRNRKKTIHVQTQTL